MHRIVVTGAESTGKTTLTEALAGYFGEPWSPEFVRQYVEKLDRPLAREDLEPIARGQLAQEDFGLEKADRFYFHDTNLLSSIIYANHYFGTVLDWVNECFLNRKYSLYLLCEPDIPWVAEPRQRESAEARDSLHSIFESTLEEMSLPYLRIRGTEAPARVHQAIDAILALKDS